MVTRAIGLLLITLAPCAFAAGQTFRVATYNVESYLDEASGHRAAKSAEAKGKVCQNLLAIKPDVLAVEEMGTTNALMELQRALKDGGLDLPFWEHVSAHDTNIHLAI